MIVSDEDMEKLVLCLAESRGDEGFTEEDAETLIKDFQGVLVGQICYDLAREGRIFLDVKDGVVVFADTLEKIRSGDVLDSEVIG